MSLDSVIAGAVAVQGTMQGVTTYPDAPEAINDRLPAFVTYPHEGELEWPRKPSQRKITHNIMMDFLVSRAGDLAGADKLLKPFVTRIMDLFEQNLALQGTCLNSGIVHYQYGKIEYAGIMYLGIRFTLRAIELNQVTYKG
jgi:hypothetical protein